LGDFSPIGRLFALGISLKMTEVALMLGLLSSTVKVMRQFRQNIGWATFWALFCQAHLVTLVSNQ
jgi:hypothetical protein